jgi:hypothetical protein
VFFVVVVVVCLLAEYCIRICFLLFSHILLSFPSLLLPTPQNHSLCLFLSPFIPFLTLFISSHLYTLLFTLFKHTAGIFLGGASFRERISAPDVSEGNKMLGRGGKGIRERGNGEECEGVVRSHENGK